MMNAKYLRFQLYRNMALSQGSFQDKVVHCSARPAVEAGTRQDRPIAHGVQRKSCGPQQAGHQDGSEIDMVQDDFATRASAAANSALKRGWSRIGSRSTSVLIQFREMARNFPRFNSSRSMPAS